MADSSALPWERYRAYLHLLARLQIPARLRIKFDSSDVVQQTMLEAFQLADRFANMDEPARAAFLRRMLANNLVDLVRRYTTEGRDIEREEASAALIGGWLAAEQSSPSHKAVREEELLSLAQALEQLPDDQRLAVEMKHLEGASVAEIAAVLERTESAVGGLLRRGLARLRELMHPPPE